MAGVNKIDWIDSMLCQTWNTTDSVVSYFTHMDQKETNKQTKTGRINEIYQTEMNSTI